MQHAIALADEGSFVRAAEKVALTQSAVSRSILALERELGVALFDRTPLGVYPTHAGRVFVERARRIVADTRALRQDVAQSGTDIAGTFAFGATPALAITCMPRLLAYCVESLPRLKVTAEVITVARLQALLRAEAIDFFIVAADGLTPDPELELHPVGTISDGGVFCRPGHPLAGRTSVLGEELLPYPLAVAGIDRQLERLYRALLQVDDASPLNVRVVCDNLFVLQRVVTTSNALLITSHSVTDELIAAGELVELPVERPTVPFEPGEIVAVALKRRSLSPAAMHLLDQLRPFFRPRAD